MTKYTFVFEFRGGTYLSQTIAGSVMDAIKMWAIEIDSSQIELMGHSEKSELISLSESIELVIVKTLDKVWCISGLLCEVFFIAHIIES